MNTLSAMGRLFRLIKGFIDLDYNLGFTEQYSKSFDSANLNQYCTFCWTAIALCTLVAHSQLSLLTVRQLALYGGQSINHSLFLNVQ